MGYGRVMGFTIKIPLSQLGKLKKVWVFREYGLSGLWLKGESTVMVYRLL